MYAIWDYNICLTKLKLLYLYNLKFILVIFKYNYFENFLLIFYYYYYYYSLFTIYTVWDYDTSLVKSELVYLEYIKLVYSCNKLIFHTF